MNEISNWFSGLATFGGFMYFLAGFGSAYLFHCGRMKLKHKTVRIPWHLAGIAIGLVAIVIVTAQTQVAYTTAKQTAISVQECQKEFNQALRSRARIAEENDKWSVEQRKALGDWLREIILPPPEIAKLRAENPNDPRVTKWGIEITTFYSNKVQEAQREQDENLEERKQHPLPEPTCGKS